MKSLSISVFSLIGAFAAFAPPARAQAPAAQTPRALTLQQALERADRQNLDLVTARLRHAVSQAGVRIAGQLPNPSFTIAAARDAPHEGVSWDQPLEIGGQRRRRIGLAQQQVSLTDLEISTVARQIRRSVRVAYFAAVHARSLTAERAQALVLVRRIQGIVKARFEAGDVPQLELLQADLEVARGEAELAVASQQEKLGQSQLNVLMNEPAGAPWDYSVPLESLLPEVTLSDLILRAQVSNPDLQHLAQEKRVEENHRALLAAERIPTLNLQFGTDFNSPPDFRVGPRGQLSLNVPLFSRNQGELAQSAATVQVIDSEIAATRRGVAGRVEAAFYEWAARQTQATLFHDSLVPVAEKLETLAEESYRAGRANILTVLDAQRNVQQVRRDYLDSLFAFQSSFADLEAAMGAALD